MQRIHPMGSQKKLQLSKGRTQESLQEAEQARTRADNAKRLMTLTESTKKLGMKKTPTPLERSKTTSVRELQATMEAAQGNFVRSAGSPRPHRIPVAAGSTSCTYASVPWSSDLLHLAGMASMWNLQPGRPVRSADSSHDRQNR